MVLAVSPVRLLMNDPVPEPSIVFEFAVVGEGEVFQHTPRDVTAASPSNVIFPPDTAVVVNIEVTVAVLRVGTTGIVFVVNERSDP